MDSWVVITIYGRDNTDNRGWLWLSVVSQVGKLHITTTREIEVTCNWDYWYFNLTGVSVVSIQVERNRTRGQTCAPKMIRSRVR